MDAVVDSGLGEWEFWCNLTNNRENANILESYDAYYNNYNDGDEYVINKHALCKLDEVEGCNLCESIAMLTEISTVDAKQKYYGEIPDAVFKSVIRSTNCKNGNISPIARYILNGYKEKGANKCGAWLTFFRDALSSMKDYPDLINELNKFVNSQPDFYDVLGKLNELEAIRDERDTQKMLGREIVTIMDTPHKVLAPLTFEASRAMYAGKTDWCTAKHKDDFNDYCNEYSWIFIVDDHYQLQFDIDNGIVSLRDDCDDEIIEDIKYLQKAYIDERWVENDELTTWYQHYCDVHGDEYGSDSLWDFLQNDCDYESFHSGAFVWDYKAIFIERFGQEAYDKIASSIESIIEQGERFKNKEEITENKIVEDEDGNYFHGTNREWDSSAGFKQDNGPIWFATYDDYAIDYTSKEGRVIVARLTYSHPFDARDIDQFDDMHWNNEHSKVLEDESLQEDSVMYQMLKYYAEQLSVTIDDILNIYYGTDLEAVYNLTRTPEFMELCKAHGFDAIEATESTNQTVGVFDNKQIEIIGEYNTSERKRIS